MPRRRESRAPSRAAASPTRSSGERQYNVRLFHGSWARDQPHSSFPDRALVSLDYWSVNRVNPGVVTYQDTVFALNGAFDPEVTGAGHQPREWDTWAAIYAKYRCRRTLVEVDLRQRAAHGLVGTLVASNSATALVVSDYPQELPRAVMMGVTGSSQPILRYRGAFDVRAVLGMTPTEFLGDDSTAALVTANPSQLVYLHVFAAQLDGTTVADFEFSLRLRMEIEFYDRKVPSVSSLVAENARLSQQLARAVVVEEEESKSR